MDTEHVYKERSLLNSISSPADLKKLKRSQLPTLAKEMRGRILDVVSKTGGHLGGPLGVVELSIALHYVFDAPKDKIIIDTGHQSYPHKLLTGRNKNFDTLRQYEGVCGFCNIFESEYDVFGAGHASTSISAALGVAAARDLKKEDFHVIAVIGDGALTAGLAYEALNNAGYLKKNMIVVLNDNEMSISPNVGAMSTYLNKVVTHPHYSDIRKRGRELLEKIPGVTKRDIELLAQAEGKVRSVGGRGRLFEDLGFTYFGPINGHNIESVMNALENLKKMEGPLLLHIKTEKGKGYEFAKGDTDKLHGMSPFNVMNGKKHSKPGQAITYTASFAEALNKIAAKNKKILGITAAMKSGTGLNSFEKEFPKRFFDVGIAEQHAVTFAAGMAREGFHPVCAIYSTFLQRGFDMIVHDVCLQKLPVIFALDRAGLVGDDGPTHAGAFDLAYMRMIPNMVVMVPKDENELQHLLYTASTINGPSSLRYPRGSGVGIELDEKYEKIPVGTGEVMQRGKNVLIIGVGPMLYDAIGACKDQGIDATVINARFVKPLDEKLILSHARKHDVIITLEEGCEMGGFGSAVAELLSEKGICKEMHRIALPDTFIDHGKPAIQKELAGISRKEIGNLLASVHKK